MFYDVNLNIDLLQSMNSYQGVIILLMYIIMEGEI